MVKPGKHGIDGWIMVSLATWNGVLIMSEPGQCGVRGWIVRGVIKCLWMKKKALATTCLSIVARASRVLVVCNRIVNKLGINLSI